LAFDIGGSNARYAEGTPESYDLVELECYDSSMSYDELLSLLQSVIGQSDPVQVGVSVPGPIHPPGIVSPSEAPSPNITWENAPLQKDLDQLVEPPVRIQRDLHCAAQAILFLEQTETFTLLYPGTGFGYASALDGEVITGTENTAGELATAPSSHGSYDEALCLSAMTEFYDKQRTPNEILDRMQEPAYQYLNRLVKLTAPLIRTTAPPTIYVGGHLAEYWDDIEPHLQEQYRDHLPYKGELRRTDITPLIGAFTLGSGDIHF
jgi:predicted NBD/HSP70 family sugar kinase